MLKTPRKPISKKKIKLIFEMLLFKKLILIRAFKIDFIYGVSVPCQLKNNKK